MAQLNKQFSMPNHKLINGIKLKNKNMLICFDLNW